jgi:hypothetical protein
MMSENNETITDCSGVEWLQSTVIVASDKYVKHLFFKFFGDNQ